MSNTTSNLGLYKPQMIDYPSTTIPQLASNFDVIDSSLAQSASQLNSLYINALYPPSGVTPAKGDGVTDDTTALNNLIQYCNANNYALYLPAATYILTNSLVINQYSGLRIIGAGREKTTLKMTSNNVPIIQSTQQDTHSVEIRNMTLTYATQQTYASQPNSYAIGFSNPTSNQNGIYFWIIDNIRVMYATVGIGCNQTSGAMPIWCFTFTNIVMFYIEHNAFNLVAPSPSGALGNVIENFSIQNGGSLVNSAQCLILTGECNLKNIDIEEWYNEVINWNTAFGTLEMLHVENHYFKGTYVDCIYVQAINVTLKDLSITYHADDPNLQQIYLVSCNQGGYKIEDVWVNRQSGSKAAALLAGSGSNTKISVNNYTFNTGEVLTYDSSIDALIKSVNGVPYNKLATVTSTSAQTINDSTWTYINFNSEITDIDNMHDNVTNNTYITIPVTGTYLVMASVQFASNATGFRSVAIDVNGSTTIAQHTANAVNGSSTKIGCYTTRKFNVGDYIQCKVQHTAGTAITVDLNGEVSPIMSAIRIA